MQIASIESRIASFLDKYTPSIKAELVDARARLRRLFPHGFELVFDNYNALVFGISPTERRSDAFISVVGYPKWVTLFFLDGVSLKDPNGLLEGQGKQVRSIRLKTAADMDRRDIQALIAQSIRPHAPALAAAPQLNTIIKLEVAAQRSRRPASKTPQAKSATTRSRTRVTARDSI